MSGEMKRSGVFLCIICAFMLLLGGTVQAEEYERVQVVIAGTVFSPGVNDENVTVPTGYTATSMIVDNYEIEAYQKEAATGDEGAFYLLYGSVNSGADSWYSFDLAENTLQRFVDSGITQTVEAQSRQIDTLNDKLASATKKYDKSSGKWQTICMILGAAAVLFLILAIILMIRNAQPKRVLRFASPSMKPKKVKTVTATPQSPFRLKNFLGEHRSMVGNLIPYIFTIVKYVFCIVLTILAGQKAGDFRYVLIGLLELAVIMLVSNQICLSVPKCGAVLNILFILFYNAEYLVLYFSRSFVTLVMLRNVDSIEALSGKANEYILGVILVAFFTFIPIKAFGKKPHKGTVGMFTSLLLAADLVLTMVYGSVYSSGYSVYAMYEQKKEQESLKADLKSDTDATQYFKKIIVDTYAKPANLVEQPNVILIFTEGLSQNIIDDERNIMPNAKALQEQSLHFENYYNHTFATYCGISGQLYSGYQLENYDENTLVSIQDVFKTEGYTTSFVNTEPINMNFTDYLEDMDFDSVISDTELVKDGLKYITDEDAYEELWEVVTEQAESGTPFFTGIYTFGTHVSLDSTDKVFQDGSDSVLNRFYNVDAALGEFLEKFNNSSLSDNTILIFTTDHATFGGEDFQQAFPDHERANPDCDAIPLMIYYKGIQPETIDAGGQNSLNLAPTIMDYLDFNEENYFLGATLLAGGVDNSMNTIFYDGEYMLSTKGGEIQELTESQKNTTTTLLQRYFLAKTQL